MENLLQDVRYGVRMLRRKPVLMIVAILTLTLGVGANTAIFSIVNAVLLRSLPFKDPDRLVRVYFNNSGTGLRDVRFSVPELDDLRNRTDIFEDVSPIFSGSVNVTGAKQPERLELLVVTPNYFSMLGATPQIGRLFDPKQDFALGFAQAVVISDALWHRSYGADPGVIGRSVRLDNDIYVIVGVLPPSFRHPGTTVARDVEVFATAGFSADPVPPPARSTRILRTAIGRLNHGLTLAQAQARLNVLAEGLRHDFANDYPPQARWAIEIQPLQETLVGKIRPILLALLGAVIITVLIVSLNIGSLLLASSSARQQEMAVRSALGASRSRIIRQMMTESLLLSFLGGLAGVAAALASLKSILRFVPANIPRLNEVNVDWRVLAFALLISLLVGLLFGLAPALQSSKSGLSSKLREGTRGAGYSAKTSRLRDALTVAEVALAVVLMIGAGLLLRTLGDLLRENPGFNPAQVVAANVWLTTPNDPKLDPYLTVAQQTAFERELLRRVSAIPGVELAGIASSLPATATTTPVGVALTVEDRPLQSLQDLRAESILVSPDYFRVMQAPLLRGRFFAENDEDGKQPVAIIDETTARHFWEGRNPIGRRVRIGPATQPWTTVVGIVKDVKHDGLDVDGVPHIYVSLYQNRTRPLGLVLRTPLPVDQLEPQIRQEVQIMDPNLPVFNVTPMNQVIARSLASRRFSADLLVLFAGLAVLLTSIGIYGLLAYMVGQRRREIGLRMALGAQPADILRLVLGKGLVLGVSGIMGGTVIAAATTSLMGSLLYGVRPHDLVVFLSVPLLLLFVALGAGLVPALRATQIDPIVALRDL